MRADGAGEPQRLLEGANWVVGALSPDQKRLGYWSRVPPYGMWTLPLDLSVAVRPKPGKPESLLQSRVVGRGSFFSPDGKWVGYGSYEAVRMEAYVRPFPGPGGQLRLSTDGGDAPHWLPNNRELFYASGDGRVRLVDYSAKGESFAPGQPRLWPEINLPLSYGSLDMMPDGKRLVVLAPTGQGDIKRPTQVVFLLNFFDELRRRVPAGK